MTEDERKLALFKELELFEQRIAYATFNKEEYVEATPTLIQYFNRNGLGKAEYFLYKGVKVFPIGRAKEILEKENRPLAEILHGKEEGVIEGRTV